MHHRRSTSGAKLPARVRRSIPQPQQPRLGDRHHPGLWYAHCLPHQLFGRADAGLRSGARWLRCGVRDRRSLLLDGQPAQLAAGPASGAGASCPAGAAWGHGHGGISPGSCPDWDRRGLGIGSDNRVVLCLLRADRGEWNHLALQPHAGIAGAAAAALGFAQTVVPSIIASAVALTYNGTAVPMMATIVLLFAICLIVSLSATSAKGSS